MLSSSSDVPINRSAPVLRHAHGASDKLLSVSGRSASGISCALQPVRSPRPLPPNSNCYPAEVFTPTGRNGTSESTLNTSTGRTNGWDIIRPSCGLDQRQNPCPYRLGQLRPSGDNEGQIGVDPCDIEVIDTTRCDDHTCIVNELQD